MRPIRRTPPSVGDLKIRRAGLNPQLQEVSETLPAAITPLFREGISIRPAAITALPAATTPKPPTLEVLFGRPKVRLSFLARPRQTNLACKHPAACDSKPPARA